MRWLRNECEATGTNQLDVIVKIARILWWDIGLRREWLD